jgi:hypothetical protein
MGGREFMCAGFTHPEHRANAIRRACSPWVSLQAEVVPIEPSFTAAASGSDNCIIAHPSPIGSPGAFLLASPINPLRVRHAVKRPIYE